VSLAVGARLDDGVDQTVGDLPTLDLVLELLARLLELLLERSDLAQVRLYRAVLVADREVSLGEATSQLSHEILVRGLAVLMVRGARDRRALFSELLRRVAHLRPKRGQLGSESRTLLLERRYRALKVLLLLQDLALQHRDVLALARHDPESLAHLVAQRIDLVLFLLELSVCLFECSTELGHIIVLLLLLLLLLLRQAEPKLLLLFQQLPLLRGLVLLIERHNTIGRRGVTIAAATTAATVIDGAVAIRISRRRGFQHVQPIGHRLGELLPLALNVQQALHPVDGLLLGLGLEEVDARRSLDLKVTLVGVVRVHREGLQIDPATRRLTGRALVVVQPQLFDREREPTSLPTFAEALEPLLHQEALEWRSVVVEFIQHDACRT